MLLYLGPGVGIGSIISLIAVFIAIAFVVYSFILLPLKKWINNRKH